MRASSTFFKQGLLFIQVAAFMLLLGAAGNLVFAEVVNINTADTNALQTIPGIGPEKAKRIIKLREESKGFSSVDELQQVKGIGAGTIERIGKHISLDEGISSAPE